MLAQTLDKSLSLYYATMFVTDFYLNFSRTLSLCIWKYQLL